MSGKNFNCATFGKVGLIGMLAAFSPSHAQIKIIQPSTYTAPTTTTTTTAPATTTTTTTAPVTTTTTTTVTTTVDTAKWGTYLFPFAADSLWNSRPVEPTFDTFVIPKSSYIPVISGGAYSTGIFLAKATDPQVTVTGLSGKPGVLSQDEEISRPITIPHWPANLVPASGYDGHADIFDPATGIIHSFWQLKQENGQWVAALYAWSLANGSGWGDPAHYYQGARATGVPTAAGLIRKHEIDDGQPMYRHALAMSLTYSGLAPNPTYIFPATSADTGASTQNTGRIPEGALVMLPPSFSAASLSSPSPSLRKVVETLKTYGAYVVDRNVGTPFQIYVENDSGYKLNTTGLTADWNVIVGDLDRIRAALRQVTSTKGWLDGNGRAMTPQTNLNVMSMRGPWKMSSGTIAGTFDTWSQTLVFPTTTKRIYQSNVSGRSLGSVTWAKRQPGTTQRFSVIATGGALLGMAVYDSTGAKAFDSGALGNGQSARFIWPQGGWATLYAASGLNLPSTVKGELITVPQ